MATAAERKTQEELEQPAKVYQLEALGSQFSALQTTTKDGFDRLTASVNTLLIKSESQVTPQQLQDNLQVLKGSLETQIEEEVKKIHLTYKPLKDNNKWLIRAIATQSIIIVGQLILVLIIGRAAS